MDEIWKIYPPFPHYRVSNFGNIQSCHSGVWKPIKLIKTTEGRGRFYLKFMACGPHGKRKVIPIHRAVAELFIGPRPPGMEIMHKDDDTGNNVWTNLEYGTHSQNVVNSYNKRRNTIL